MSSKKITLLGGSITKLVLIVLEPGISEHTNAFGKHDMTFIIFLWRGLLAFELGL